MQAKLSSNHGGFFFLFFFLFGWFLSEKRSHSAGTRKTRWHFDPISYRCLWSLVDLSVRCIYASLCARTGEVGVTVRHPYTRNGEWLSAASHVSWKEPTQICKCHFPLKRCRFQILFYPELGENNFKSVCRAVLYIQMNHAKPSKMIHVDELQMFYLEVAIVALNCF